MSLLSTPLLLVIPIQCENKETFMLPYFPHLDYIKVMNIFIDNRLIKVKKKTFLIL